MNDKSAKQKLSEKIRAVSNVLITVSRNPSVDALSAALALTFALDRLGKHATAVFSGQIPPAMGFLKPEKTFENNADSLRDFIISLDKDKADRLRYKVDGDLVRIFITPYRTRISESDLNFSEGDYNVELIIALGVENRDELDEAIAAHGKILHSAILATVNADNQKNSLGTIVWNDEKASSLSEMVAVLCAGLADPNAKKPLLDEAVSTALLTGIVAATDQFTNAKTSPTSMKLSADLMARGANQQLIAKELAQKSSDRAEPAQDASTVTNPDDSGVLRLRDTADEPDDHEDAVKKDDEPVADQPAAPTVPDNLDQNLAKADQQVDAAASQAALAKVEAELNQRAASAKPEVMTPPVNPTTAQPVAVSPAPMTTAQMNQPAPELTPVAPPVNPPAPVQPPTNPAQSTNSPSQVTVTADPTARLDQIAANSAGAGNALADLQTAVAAAQDLASSADTHVSAVQGAQTAAQNSAVKENYVGDVTAPTGPNELPTNATDAPMTAANVSDEPPDVQPFAAPTPDNHPELTIQPLANPIGSAPATSPTNLNQNLTNPGVNSPAPSNFDLPLPPPPPIPEFGQLPPNGADLNQNQSATAPKAAAPMITANPTLSTSATPPTQPVAAQAPIAPPANPLFPEVDTNADPTAFHIPGQN
jgi:hypothetical protein